MSAKILPFAIPPAKKLVLGEVVYLCQKHLPRLQAEFFSTMLWDLKANGVLPEQHCPRDLEATALVMVLMAAEVLPDIEGRLCKAVADYALFAREVDYEVE